MNTPAVTDYQRLDDPALIAERARVRERLEHTPEHDAGHTELERRYAGLTAEFDQRARCAWAAPHD